MVQVDKNLCIACGVCYSVHPDFFVVGADGKAEAIKQAMTEEDDTTVDDAIASCPATAISA